jgi:wyosine [tRNA(Phe)-imidazoG37] synthetase (radical SAM superfamily)
MTTLTQEQIKEIAQELDCGNKCFVHKETNELIFIPDTDRNPTMDTEFFEEELEKIDNNFDDYNVIETLESSESFEIMADFTEQLADNNDLKTKLANALSKKKPFREFKFVIDNSGAYRQEWFDFKNSKLEEFVRNRLNELADGSESR